MTASPADLASLAILIPTYGRDHVLIETISALLDLPSPASEILVLDQTSQHVEECASQLARWHASQAIQWIRIPYPSITVAMNMGLVMATSELVLFLDDDIIPDPDLLVAHRSAAQQYPQSLIAGRVLQPWHDGQPDPADSAFAFNHLEGRYLKEFMGGNVSMDRQMALKIGGFDRNFVSVAYRFEAEFAFRWLRSGSRIRYEPKALIHHLKVSSGGTRTYGHHLTTIRPDHAVGRYYFNWRTCSFPIAFAQSAGSFFRSILTRHHARKPWWIPLTLFAELRGFLWSCRLAMAGPSLQKCPPVRLLIITSHPIQYQVPLFRLLASDPYLDVEVLFLTLPDAAHQGEGFGVPFVWDTPLLTGYQWRQAQRLVGDGGLSEFSGLRLQKPSMELNNPASGPPDAVLITGWQCLGLLQLCVAALMKRIPVLLRMENNDQRHRKLPQRLLQRFLVNQTKFVLPVGHANARYYRGLGVDTRRMILAPYCVDNEHFAFQADQARPRRNELRRQWGIADGAFCFLFCGKFQHKKHPGDILDALQLLKTGNASSAMHCIFVGSGALAEQLNEQVTRSQLPVTFVGFLNQGQLSSAYVAADALVLPSDGDETWGLVVNEAMACGLPAIVSDRVGCSDDLIQEGVTGFRYPCGNIEALANAMQAMAAHPLASQEMGRRASDLVHSRYSLQAAALAIRQAAVLAFCRSSQ
jgi:glycosyltransferase involved in cell wall biosynthesis